MGKRILIAPPGSGRSLSAQEIASMKPNSPARDIDKEIIAATASAYEAMSWQEQAESIRKLNGRFLAIVAARVQNDKATDADVNMLARISSIAKAWAEQEESDDEKPKSREELERLAKR